MQQDAKALGEIDEDDEDKEEEEQMPTSVVRPKYKIVFSYPANIEDTWEGFSTNEGFKNKGLDHKIPKELTITILLVLMVLSIFTCFSMLIQFNLLTLKEEDGQNIKVDETTQHRENFLKVYSEDKNTLNTNNDDDDLSNLKDIKFKQNLDEEDDSQSNIKITGINDRDVGKKPLIQEIKTTSITTTQVNSNANNSLPDTDQKQVTEQAQTQIEAFSWETAERVVAKYQFFHQKELVFVNLNFKGYNKLTDVRYALSENELLLEVRHPPQSNQIHRMYYTLNKEIDVAQSNIDLLVDFISIKLKKQDKDSTWNSVGYEISDFTIPLKGQMKSNFLKHEKPVQKLASNQDEDKENINNDNKQVDDGNNGLDDKQNVENQQVEQLQQEVTRKIDTAQLNFMNLDSSVIFKIY